MWPNLPNALGRYLESLTRIGTIRPGWPSPATGTRRIWPPDSSPSGPPPAAGGGDAGHCPAGGGTERLPGGQPHDLGYPGRQLGGLSPESEVVRHGRGPGPFGIPGGGGGPLYAPWTRRAWPAIPPSKTGEPPGASAHRAGGPLLKIEAGARHKTCRAPAEEREGLGVNDTLHSQWKKTVWDRKRCCVCRSSPSKRP